MSVEFVGFPKIARYSREVIVTEKIDGTNGCIYIKDCDDEEDVKGALFNACAYSLYAGSRSQWITPENDNHGFAKWVVEHGEELIKLGPGRHFGEWWGSGIQRGYGLTKGDKRFSLFNTIRWCRFGEMPQPIPCGDPRVVKTQDVLPPCVGLVPILWRGNFDNFSANATIDNLIEKGSSAAPGFMQPEGIVIFHVAGNVGFKKTILKDNEHKGQQS